MQRMGQDVRRGICPGDQLPVFPNVLDFCDACHIHPFSLTPEPLPSAMVTPLRFDRNGQKGESIRFDVQISSKLPRLLYSNALKRTHRFRQRVADSTKGTEKANRARRRPKQPGGTSALSALPRCAQEHQKHRRNAPSPLKPEAERNRPLASDRNYPLKTSTIVRSVLNSASQISNASRVSIPDAVRASSKTSR